MDRQKRVFLIVLDSFGVGEMEDAGQYGDIDVNTLRSVSRSPHLHIPNMTEAGLYALAEHPPKELKGADAAYARMTEASKGKDTTIGHWEIAGLISEKPLPTYPNGFPQEILDRFCEKTGRGVLCNKPYSGTEVIRDYGDEHQRTGKLIVYTSADSVFQIAAHEDIVPVEQLYAYCVAAREILQGEHGVGRVIARPFTGPMGGPYVRSPKRHDYSILPPGITMLDQLCEAGLSVVSVGKIRDIFAGRGMTRSIYTKNNNEGIEETLVLMDEDFQGLVFTNLVDFDMVYGHRRDVDGYAKALSAFDEALPRFLEKLREDDLLMITADHGCDPAYQKTTDHTREYTPFLMFGKNMVKGCHGVRKTFADIGATVLQYLEVPAQIEGTPFGLMQE